MCIDFKIIVGIYPTPGKLFFICSCYAINNFKNVLIKKIIFTEEKPIVSTYFVITLIVNDDGQNLIVLSLSNKYKNIII